MDEEAASQIVGERVASVRRLRAASAATVLLVRTASGAEFVVKTVPPEHRASIDKEAAIYALVDQHGLELPVPRVHRRVEGALVLERLAGAEPTQVDDVALSRATGRLLATLHRITFDRFGYLTAEGIVDPQPTNLAAMNALFERLASQYEDAGGDPRFRSRAARHIAVRRHLLEGCKQAVLCHNDAHESNLLLDETGRITALFDFQNAVAGDPLFDLAKTVFFSRRDRRVVREALAEGYGPLRPHWRDTLDLYLLYHQLELWVFLASLGVAEGLDAIEADMRGIVDT